MADTGPSTTSSIARGEGGDAPLIGIADVRAAAARIEGHVLRTPFLQSETLGDLTGAALYLKFENLQFTGSFKQRGALNALLSLTARERASGVVAVSAGNHAQGLAYHAAKLGIPATIVMPTGTPTVKAQRTRAFGAEVILSGKDLAEAFTLLPSLVAERGLTLIHPFDDDRIIAGQGTVALEMLEDEPDLDAIVVPVGGGGLIAGMAAVVRALSPATRIIGVQSERFPSMARALDRWAAPGGAGPSIAEGIAVAAPGARPRAHAAASVDDVLVVTEEAIERSVSLLLQIEKTLVEGAAAAGLAAILAYPEHFRGRRVGVVLTGGNIDNRLLIAILRRQQAREGMIVRLGVQLPDQAGSLAQLCADIGQAGGNIDLVLHDRSFRARDAKSVRVEIEFELADPLMITPIRQRLTDRGFILDRPAG